MSALKLMATMLWTQLLEGLRSDGLIASCVLQSGPATTRVILDMCEAPWINADTPPTPSRHVAAIDELGNLIGVYWSEDVGWCLTHNDLAPKHKVHMYTFVNTDGVPR